MLRRGYVGEGEHFPALRSEAGEAQPVGKADRPHIHWRQLPENYRVNYRVVIPSDPSQPYQVIPPSHTK
jgi:hypothetical protein